MLSASISPHTSSSDSLATSQRSSNVISSFPDNSRFSSTLSSNLYLPGMLNDVYSISAYAGDNFTKAARKMPPFRVAYESHRY